jgi:hypothetical protein
MISWFLLNPLIPLLSILTCRALHTSFPSIPEALGSVTKYCKKKQKKKKRKKRKKEKEQKKMTGPLPLPSSPHQTWLWWLEYGHWDPYWHRMGWTPRRPAAQQLFLDPP